MKHAERQEQRTGKGENADEGKRDREGDIDQAPKIIKG